MCSLSTFYSCFLKTQYQYNKKKLNKYGNHFKTFFCKNAIFVWLTKVGIAKFNRKLDCNRYI